MIVYHKGIGGINLLFRVYGSPWPRALPLALPSVLLAVLLDKLAKNETRDWFLHPLPFGVFASVLGFVLGFRINLSHQRYWEVRSRIQDISSKWAIAAAEALVFNEAAKEPAAATGRQWRAEFVHLMSLMHGTAMQVLRGDTMIDNLVRGSYFVTPFPPPKDPAQLPNWQKYNHLCALRHHMNHFREYWMNLPLPVLGGLSKAEIQVLEKNEDSRVFCVFTWVHQHLTARNVAGGMGESPPIVTRIHQNLADGMTAFNQASKVDDTPFPFPYAQTVTIMLWLQAVLCPITMVAWLNNTAIVVLFTFATVWSNFTLNEVAREIEEPLKYDPNDIPVAFLHHHFNLTLLAAFNRNKPEEEDKLLEHIKADNLDDFSLSPSDDYTERGAFAKHAKEALEAAERERREQRALRSSSSSRLTGESQDKSGIRKVVADLKEIGV